MGRRLRAARILRGFEKREALGRQLKAEYDLAWTALGKYERGEEVLPGKYRLALAEVLGVPRTWFTEPLEQLLHQEQPDEGLRETLGQLETKLDRLLAGEGVARFEATLTDPTRARRRGSEPSEETPPSRPK